MTNVNLIVDVTITEKWETKARRNVRIAADSIDELAAIAGDMSPAFAVMVRKIVEEVLAQKAEEV